MSSTEPARDDHDDPRLRAVVLSAAHSAAVVDGRWMTCPTTVGCWIVDLLTSTLCRTEDGTDPRFVSPEYWQPYEAIWLDDHEVRAALTSGTRLTATLRTRT